METHTEYHALFLLTSHSVHVVHPANVPEGNVTPPSCPSVTIRRPGTNPERGNSEHRAGRSTTSQALCSPHEHLQGSRRICTEEQGLHAEAPSAGRWRRRQRMSRPDAQGVQREAILRSSAKMCPTAGRRGRRGCCAVNGELLLPCNLGRLVLPRATIQGFVFPCSLYQFAPCLAICSISSEQPGALPVLLQFFPQYGTFDIPIPVLGT